jgi:hypothetical protein
MRETARFTYNFYSPFGELEAVQVRIEFADGKKVAPMYGPGGKTFRDAGLTMATLPLFGTEHLIEGETAPGSMVLLVEGPKKADLLRSIHGYNAVATVSASVTPFHDALAVLRPFEVVLCPDNDQKGREHMANVGNRLVGICDHPVRVLEWEGAPEKGDLVDFFKLGGTTDQLDQMLADAPLFVPSEDADAPAMQSTATGKLTVSFAEFAQETDDQQKAESLWGRFLVRGGGYLLVGGEGGVGKTVLLANLAVRMAAGESEFLGFDLPGRKVKILFLEGEGSRLAFRDWIVKIARNLGYDPDELPIFFRKRDAVLDLGGNLRRMIEETGAEFVILDPIASFFTGQENDNAQWREGVTRPVREISEAMNVVVAFADHFTKPNELRTGKFKVRGAGAKLDDCGAGMRLEIVKGGSPERVLFFDRVRDGELPDPDRIALTIDLKAGTIGPDDAADLSNLGTTEDVRSAYVADVIRERGDGAEVKTADLKAELMKRYEIGATQAEGLIRLALAKKLIERATRGRYRLPGRITS